MWFYFPKIGFIWLTMLGGETYYWGTDPQNPFPNLNPSITVILKVNLIFYLLRCLGLWEAPVWETVSFYMIHLVIGEKPHETGGRLEGLTRDVDSFVHLKFILIPWIYFVHVNIQVESIYNLSVQTNLDIDEHSLIYRF